MILIRHDNVFMTIIRMYTSLIKEIEYVNHENEKIISYRKYNIRVNLRIKSFVNFNFFLRFSIFVSFFSSLNELKTFFLTFSIRILMNNDVKISNLSVFARRFSNSKFFIVEFAFSNSKKNNTIKSK